MSVSLQLDNTVMIDNCLNLGNLLISVMKYTADVPKVILLNFNLPEWIK